MSSQLYRYITRSSFVLATVSVLCVDRFPHSIAPTVVMICAALISVGAYVISRAKSSLTPGENDENCAIETSSEQELVSQATHGQKHSENEVAKSVGRSRATTMAELAKRRAEIEYEFARLAQDYEGKMMLSVAQRKLFIAHGYQQTVQGYFVAKEYMAAYSRHKAHHSPITAAVEIAKSLGSTEYDVSLTLDGTIKISRVARTQPATTSTMQNKPQQSFRLEEFSPAYPIQ